MIYLFNSARRPEYLTNVFNTQFLPIGAANEYRYNFPRHVHPALLDSLMYSRKDDGDVAVVFADRFSPGAYSYLPLRLGRLVDTYKDGDRQFFVIHLGDYICPKDPAAFGAILPKALPTLPRLTNNDPTNDNDGHYAIEGPSLFKDRSAFSYGDEAWARACRSLARAQAFQSSEGREPIFLKAHIRTPGDRGGRVAPSKSGPKPRFPIPNDSSVDLSISYYYPAQESDKTATARMVIKADDSVRLSGDTEIPVGAVQTQRTVTIHPRRYSDERHATVRVAEDHVAGRILALNLPQAPIEFSIVDSCRFRISVLALILALSAFSALVAVDYSSLGQITISAILQSALPRLLFTFPQAVLTYWLFRMIGKSLL